VPCASCGSEASAEARFCANCGSRLARDPTFAASPPRSDRPAVPTGDRRVVTALFADLVDYVRMLAENDPEEVRTRVTAALGAMAEIIARFGGTREKFIGDAIFAVFGWPLAHDDDAVRAAMAALHIRSALHDIGAESGPLEVRMGLATGEVVAAGPGPSEDGDLRLTGAAITTAARIQSLARPGEILLDGATLHAARGRLSTASSGHVVLRGQAAAVELHALHDETGLGLTSAGRPPVVGPLVGREAERAAVVRVIERCQASGVGGVVLVVGEAGVGKTRLLADVEPVAVRAGLRWTWTENVSYGRTEPYRYIRLFAQAMADEQGVDSGSLTRRLLFTEDLDPETARRYGGAIAAVARDASFSGWEAEASDMPSDPAEIAGVLIDLAERYLARLLETTGPRVVVIDDLHWQDPSSVGMIELLVESTRRYPLVVLASTRPADLPRWADRPDIVRLELSGLDAPDTAHLATIIARAAVDAEGARSLHERTGGNPLFVGETVRAFLEDGTMELRDGRVALVDPSSTRVPITLRAVLGARIDALDPEAREAVGVASIIGIRFHEDHVASLLDESLRPGVLGRLAQEAIIQPVEEGEWRFAHPLIHDAAYAGLLASHRRILHARLADQLERRPGPAVIEQLAAHRAAAGDADRAVPLLRLAAQRAQTMGAPMEAAALWRRAADMIEATDPAGAAADRREAAQAMASAEALLSMSVDRA
jgi:class 3 adenylate cyclase